MLYAVSVDNYTRANVFSVWYLHTDPIIVNGLFTLTFFCTNSDPEPDAVKIKIQQLPIECNRDPK